MLVNAAGCGRNALAKMLKNVQNIEAEITRERRIFWLDLDVLTENKCFSVSTGVLVAYCLLQALS